MPDSAEQIAQLIRQGKKIEAIKLLRETTGLDLQRAKEEVERLQAALDSGMVSPENPEAEALPPEVEALLRQGKKIEAIKRLREATGMGLKEAKERVESVSGTARQGCGTSLLLAVIVTVGLTALRLAAA
ncbi:MAG: ribosomal protein L7/L12 [Verrucomicrobiales bacterium]